MWRLHWSLSVCRTAWIVRYINSRHVIPRGVETVSEDFVLMAPVLILNAFKIRWRLSVHIRQSENLKDFLIFAGQFPNNALSQTLYNNILHINASSLSLFSLPSLFHFSNIKLFTSFFWWGMTNISHTISLLSVNGLLLAKRSPTYSLALIWTRQISLPLPCFLDIVIVLH